MSCLYYKENFDERINEIFDNLIKRCPNEPMFAKTVKEYFYSLKPLYKSSPELFYCGIPERITEPEKTIIFRVPWTDDKGEIRVNRGYRVKFSTVLGAGKGGLRFKSGVNLDEIKTLAFSQVFKNALTGLPMGGAKGGADFDSKGKSDGEVMRFCQSFAKGLYNSIGEEKDIPAGDMGVGEREIGYMFGEYKRLTERFGCSFTGKGISYGGLKLRKEATGYGLVYFVNEILKDIGEEFSGKRAVVSGSGNVALYAIKKAISLGATIVAASDSDGVVYDDGGIDCELLKEIKEEKRGRIREYMAVKKRAVYYDNPKDIWRIKCDFAFPCATQNELDEEDAEALIKNGCKLIAEGANLPCTGAAIEKFKKSGIIFAPFKAANAGGVAASGFEIIQNSAHFYFTEEESDKMLKEIMRNIYITCRDAAKENGAEGDLTAGANISSYKKVAAAVLAEGCV